jgi:hypothetical protein
MPLFLPSVQGCRDDELDGPCDVEPERKRKHHTDPKYDTHPSVSGESSLKVWRPNQKKRKGKKQYAVLSDANEDAPLPKKRGKDELPVIAPKRGRHRSRKDKKDVHLKCFDHPWLWR